METKAIMDIDEIMRSIDDYAGACEYNLTKADRLRREIFDAITAMSWVRVVKGQDGTYGPMPEQARWICWICPNADVTGTECIVRLEQFVGDSIEGAIAWQYIDVPEDLDQWVTERESAQSSR